MLAIFSAITRRYGLFSNNMIEKYEPIGTNEMANEPVERTVPGRMLFIAAAVALTACVFIFSSPSTPPSSAAVPVGDSRTGRWGKAGVRPLATDAHVQPEMRVDLDAFTTSALAMSHHGHMAAPIAALMKIPDVSAKRVPESAFEHWPAYDPMAHSSLLTAVQLPVSATDHVSVADQFESLEVFDFCTKPTAGACVGEVIAPVDTPYIIRRTCDEGLMPSFCSCGSHDGSSIAHFHRLVKHECVCVFTGVERRSTWSMVMNCY